MATLADANVAARRVLTADPAHAEIKRAVDALLLRGETVTITAQNLVEFQALATRPLESNGLGMTSAEANEQARDMEAIFPLLDETPAVYTHWRVLMERYDVRGRQVYDARLVAVMLAHDVPHIFHHQRQPLPPFPGDHRVGAQGRVRRAMSTKSTIAHGKTFHDGGWFDTEGGKKKPQVQVQTDRGGAWKTIATLDSYPNTTATDALGLQSGQKFEAKFASVTVIAVRVLGRPACGDRSEQTFASCAELQTFLDLSDTLKRQSSISQTSFWR